MNKANLAEMHAKGYRYRIRETDASHIAVDEPLCVRRLGDVHLYYFGMIQHGGFTYSSSCLEGIFEIDDICADGSTVPVSTIQILHQRKSR